jgi:hypothetical protein
MTKLEGMSDAEMAVSALQRFNIAHLSLGFTSLFVIRHAPFLP